MKKPRKPEVGQSLADTNPELAKQWHPTKNGDLTPSDVRAGSTMKAWWKCPEGEDHEWDAVIADRDRGIGCAICSNYKVVKSNSLVTLNPQLASQWHPTKNKTLTPNDVHPGSAKKVWWKCPRGDDHEWQTVVYSRTGGKGCPICDGKKVVPSTCLATVEPELAKQWHPTKNGTSTPYNTGPNSKKRIWWKCPEGDDHEWQTVVNSRRLQNLGCPICSNQKIVLSNCLATLEPELANTWHPTKNGKVTPYNVGPGSGKRVWWKCPEGDDHEWRTTVYKRVSSKECPICIGRKVVDSNSFLTLYPELAKQWHPTKNGNLSPNDFRPNSNKLVWWKCPKGDDHEWRTSFNTRTSGSGCPKCNWAKSGPELRVYCELKSIFPSTENRTKVLGSEVDIYIPELKMGIEYDGWYWHKDKVEMDLEKNKKLKNELLLLRVREKGLEKLSETDILLSKTEITLDAVKEIFRFILNTPSIDAKTYSRAIESYLTRNDWAATDLFNKTLFERNGLVYERSLSYLYPEIASQWHYEKNYPLVPEQFTPTSKEKVWWKDKQGKERQAVINAETKREKDRKEKHTNQHTLFDL